MARRSEFSGLRPFVDGPKLNGPVSVSAGASATSLRGPLQANPTYAGVTRETRNERESRKQGIQELLESYFEPHRRSGGEAPNSEDFDRLIADRVQQLLDMGENKERIEASFLKAAKLDIAAEAGRGFVGSLPFGVMSRVLDTQPSLGNAIAAGLGVLPGIKNTSEVFRDGAAAGLASGVADEIGSEALRSAMTDNQWLSSSSDALEEPMKNAKEAAQPGMVLEVARQAAAIQFFTARNLLRGIVASTLTAAHRAADAAQADSYMAAIGSPFAGAAFNLANRHFAAQGHRIGPEYLLGRTDWKERYVALKAATWKGAVANGAGRVAQAGFNLVNAIPSAPHSLLAATSLTKNVGALGVGLGAVSMATTGAGALAKKMGANDAGVVAAEHAGRTLSSAGVFPLWTTAAIVTDPVVKAARGAANAVGDILQKGVSKGVLKSAEVAGQNARAGADYALPKLRDARATVIQTGRNTIKSVATTVSGMSYGMSQAVGSATDALGKAVVNVRRRAHNAGAQSAGQPVQGVSLGEDNV